ncbi:hypothetical protein AAG906_007166 [Vitis piasezkii]
MYLVEHGFPFPLFVVHVFANGELLLIDYFKVESQHYHPAIDQTVYQYFVLPLQGKTADRAIIDVNMEKLDFYSLADHHHLFYTNYFIKMPWPSLINSRPKVKAWWEDISSMPAYKKVVECTTFGEK